MRSRMGARKETKIYTLGFIELQIPLSSPSTKGSEVMLEIQGVREGVYGVETLCVISKLDCTGQSN